MKNSADLGGCYPPRPSASVVNTLLYLQNSSYPTQPHSIIAKYSPLAFPEFNFQDCFCPRSSPSHTELWVAEIKLLVKLRINENSFDWQPNSKHI